MQFKKGMADSVIVLNKIIVKQFYKMLLKIFDSFFINKILNTGS